MMGRIKLGLVVLACLMTGCVSAERYGLVSRQYDDAEAARAAAVAQAEKLEAENIGLKVDLQRAQQDRKQLADRSSRDRQQSKRQLEAQRAGFDKQMADAKQKTSGLSEKLESAMRDLARHEGIEYEPGSGKLKLSAQVLFEAGQSKIRESGRSALRKLAAALKGGPEWLRIEGYTDADPVRKTRARWKHGNWELSGNRSLEVLAFLEHSGVGGNRMQFVGRGPYQPTASNLTTAGKRANRRVEIYITAAPPVEAEGLKK